MLDKSWIHEPRVSEKYVHGALQFLDFAFQKASSDGKVMCPCVNCNNCFRMSRQEVFEHIICHGFNVSYTHWVCHGERLHSFTDNVVFNDSNDSEANEQMHEMLNDTFGFSIPSSSTFTASQSTQQMNVEAEKFFKLINDAEQELYPGCKRFTKLSFLVRFYQIKCLNGWSDNSFTMMLDLLKEALPDGETLPKSIYEAKKIIKDLGLDYKNIHACPNDCQLYWKTTIDDEKCRICGASRWKQPETEDENTRLESSSKGPKIAAKVLRHFPLIPRLQRLFMSSKISPYIRWHDEERTKDNMLRHPADSPAWKTFDYLHPNFSSDSRNVRLGLSSDGFNPFRTMSISHSTWPVILMPYNLPPWMCMKEPYFIMSLLIPGPSSPGNDIDVYLQPLIDELKELWEVGVETYDASRKEIFTMHAAILWTISDFPAYANLSGWSTKGKYACPHCNKDTWFHQLKYGRKFCYMGHRRFLDHNHRFRFEHRSFDGNQEHRIAPKSLSGSDVLAQLQGFTFKFGKESQEKAKRRRMHDDNVAKFYNWKKRSIFFDLPYWENNLLRHNLDVMHIEKNVCESLLNTLFNVEGKSKDNAKSRQDLQAMNIRHALHLKSDGYRTVMPLACFTMKDKEKKLFCRFLKKIKFPDGYAANMSRNVQVKPPKISGFKSHDFHIVMQQILPLVCTKTLPRVVSSVLVELSNFFRELCSKVLNVHDLQRLERGIGLTLCHLERIFPPSFFDIMLHLPIHLAREASVAGPVHYRWMYPIERYLLKLKSYVRTRSHPEGSIAEGYIVEECLTFCSRYLNSGETKFNRPIRNNEGIDDTNVSEGSSFFKQEGRPLGNCEAIVLDKMDLKQAHRYVLFNNEEVAMYLIEHKNAIKCQQRRIRPKDLERIHNEKFSDWFKEHVLKLRSSRGQYVSQEVACLARGPSEVARQFDGYIINGFRFHTKNREIRRKTQNSGVVITAKTSSFSSASDRNPIVGDVTYYGMLKHIIELDYNQAGKVVLFKCDWVDVLNQERGVKRDDFGNILVNLTRLCHRGQQLSDEPFVFANQVQQVFYIQEPQDIDWHYVRRIDPRDFFDMQAISSEDDLSNTQEDDRFAVDGANLHMTLEADDTDSLCWVRTDMAAEIIDTPLPSAQRDPTENDQQYIIDEEDD